MPTSTLRRRPALVGVARAGSVLALAASLVACSGGGTAGDDPVPTLLTAPLASSTSTTSTVATSSSTTPVTTGASTTSAGSSSTGASTSVAASSSTSSTAAAAPSTSASPSGPGSAAPTSGPATSSGPTSTVAATTTTLDIEPPPSTPPPTAPVPTAAEPPDTIGGRDEDYLLTPRSLVGLQFGASTATVLARLVDLLGDPLRVTALPDCPDGAATAYQWLNAGVIVTAGGLTYYLIGMDYDLYGEAPIPLWHTAAGLEVGDDRAALDAAYAGQVAYEAPSGSSVAFTITTGPDAGMEGTLVNDVLQSVSAGRSDC